MAIIPRFSDRLLLYKQKFRAAREAFSRPVAQTSDASQSKRVLINSENYSSAYEESDMIDLTSRRERGPVTHSGEVSDLCSCCNADKTTLRTFYWDGTLDDLQSAANNGCIRCSFLALCVACFAPDIFQKENGFRVWSDFGLCELRVYSGDECDNFALDIFALPGQNSTPFPRIPTKRLLPGDTSSTVTFTTIADWMQDCIANHTDCNSPIASSNDTCSTPKRLLDLRDSRVVLRENLSDRPIYACLSHCWGYPNAITKTKLENIETFKTEVPWENMTATYRDAVTTCRRMKIDFLWIDSLCIIQNCKDDWNEQALQMASIYRNAFITIAATKSRGSSEGCYGATKADHLAEVVPGTDIYVRRQPPKFPTHWTEISPEEWPLLNRGWIYQEMRLSRRILHFCSQEVMWECQHARRSESGCSDTPLGSSDPKTYVHTMYNAIPYSKLMDDARKLWYKTVQEYSRLQLTFEEDKMPALSALTRDMEALRVDDRFLVGLWEKTLILDLLWMVWPTPKTGRLATWRAPTWSWACIQSQVMWGSSVDHVLSCVEVADIRCVTTGPACMGETQESSITLHVPLLKARLESRELRLDPNVPSQDYITVYDYKMDYDVSAPGPYHISLPATVFIAPIGVDKLNHSHEALVLLSRQEKGVYERIGLVQLRIPEFLDELTSPSRDATGYNRLMADREEYDRLTTYRQEKTDVLNTILEGLPVYRVTLI